MEIMKPILQMRFVGQVWRSSVNDLICKDPISAQCKVVLQARVSACALWRLQSFNSRRAFHGPVHTSCSTASTTVGDLDNRDSISKRYVVLVESPAKAKTIEKYLGADFLVLPSNGHVRDLAARVGSVRPDNDYAMVWEVPEGAQTHLAKIKEAIKGAKCLVLASDPDREGEAIAWHLSELMKAEGVLKTHKLKVVRVTFNEITKSAVLQAMQAPRDISMTLVNAYLARRALDYLIGFALSPVLWRKLPGSRSAGRVQSAALCLVCEREAQIEQFVAQEYWTVEASGHIEQVANDANTLTMRPTHFEGKKLERHSLASAEDANQVSEKIKSSKIRVVTVRKSQMLKMPLQPFITSTLQQEAQVKLGFGVVRTMAVAQKLYEGVKLGNNEVTGLITYMRTDGLQLSNDAVKSIRLLTAERYGDKYVPQVPRSFQSKVKNAQEAHEAIRPTDVYRLPSELHDFLEKDALSLYSLIWRRTMACQMQQAVFEEVSVDLATGDDVVRLRASSSNLVFPGFLSAMQDKDVIHLEENEATKDLQGQEDTVDEIGGKLPPLKEGDLISVERVEPSQHFTRPPPRFSEGSLVKAMEELGIGRPSTYTVTLKTLQSRKYVKHEKSRIVPEVRGRLVAAFLASYFPKFVDYNFTANLEEQLDEVSGGQSEWKDVLRGFWADFHASVSSVMKIPIEDVVSMLQKRFSNQLFKGLGEDGCICPSCSVGKLTLKLSRYGAGFFFGCDRYPECRFKTQFLDVENEDSPVEHEKGGSSGAVGAFKNGFSVGIHPVSNLEIIAKSGPFGQYVTDGEGRCYRIPEWVKLNDVTLEQAVQYMKYPVILGKHPEDGTPVWLGIGKSSAYVRHRSTIAPLRKDENKDDMNLDKALTLLQGDKATYRGRRKPEVSVPSLATTAMKQISSKSGKREGRKSLGKDTVLTEKPEGGATVEKKAKKVISAKSGKTKGTESIVRTTSKKTACAASLEEKVMTRTRAKSSNSQRKASMETKAELQTSTKPSNRNEGLESVEETKTPSSSSEVKPRRRRAAKTSVLQESTSSKDETANKEAKKASVKQGVVVATTKAKVAKKKSMKSEVDEGEDATAKRKKASSRKKKDLATAEEAVPL